MRNVKLVLSYDGTRYLGWQETAMGPSISEELRLVLEKIAGQPIKLQAASRTDAGVHAEGQVVNFFLKNDNIDLTLLHISLNQLLPPDIAVVDIQHVSDDFHPTLHARYKEYRYNLNLGPVPFPLNRLYSWHCPYKLDLEEMKRGCEELIGEHDFSSFCNVKKNDRETDFVRKMISINLIEGEKNRLTIALTANRFLYRMARNIAGTLVYVGRGKLRSFDIAEILAKKDRRAAAVTAPSHGLTLREVIY